MIKLKDSEGDKLEIKNMDGNESWNTYISGDYQDDNNGGYSYKGMCINISIPEYLTDGEKEYSSFGLLYCDLKEVFQSYIDEVVSDDGGESLPFFIELLEAFAKKAKEKQLEINNTTY